MALRENGCPLGSAIEEGRVWPLVTAPLPLYPVLCSRGDRLCNGRAIDSNKILFVSRLVHRPISTTALEHTMYICTHNLFIYLYICLYIYAYIYVYICKKTPCRLRRNDVEAHFLEQRTLVVVRGKWPENLAAPFLTF